MTAQVTIAPAGVSLVTLAGAAKRCKGVSASTLRTWRSRHGDFPAPTIAVSTLDGMENYYSLAAVAEWVDERRRVG